MTHDELMAQASKVLPPELLARLLAASSEHIRMRDQYLADLEAEKGTNHRIMANMTIKGFGLATLLALLCGRLERGFENPEKMPEAADVTAKFMQIVECVQHLMNELAENLEVPKEDYQEMARVAEKINHMAVDSAPRG